MRLSKYHYRRYLKIHFQRVILKMSEKTALVILSEFAEELEVASPVDFLRLCKVKVTVAGLNGEGAVKCARGLIVVPEVSLEKVKEEEFDVIIMPGGRVGSDLLADSTTVGEILKRQDQRGGLIAGICGSPKALLRNEIGFGKKITSYPTSKNLLCTKYDYSDEPVVQDGNLITARGPAQSLAWSEVIGKNLVDADALKVALDRMLFENTSL